MSDFCKHGYSEEQVKKDLCSRCMVEQREKLKTQVIVKLELLRGCCNMASIKKSQIAKAIQEFIKELESK